MLSAPSVVGLLRVGQRLLKQSNPVVAKRWTLPLRTLSTGPSKDALKMDEKYNSTYHQTYEASMADPIKFWGDVGKDLHWFKPFDTVLDESNPPFYKWYAGGMLNASYNALDVHVENGRGDNVALIYDSPVTNTIQKFSYNDLLKETATMAGALRDMGVEKGDRVMIYMPMVPQTIVAMLACARIGAIHSVVFGGFASNELATRIDDATPKVVLAASCGIEPKGAVEYKPLLDEGIRLAKHTPEKCVILQRPQCEASLVPGRDVTWEQALQAAKPVDAVPVESSHPLYVLYTSGTTGQPKGVVRDTGGYLASTKWSMKSVYGMEPGEVYWAASDLGWVVGHTYICYAPLVYGCPTVLYEGKPVGTPDAGAFWRVIEQHKVKTLFTAPTAFRAIKKEDPQGDLMKKYNLEHFKVLKLAGERADPATVSWALDMLERPVLDHWWQTETGWPIAANCVGLTTLPIKLGSSTKPVPGYDVRILELNQSEDGDEDAEVATDASGARIAAKEVPRGQFGSIAVRLPLPPGTFQTLWKDEDRFVSSYFAENPGFYTTGDAGYMDEDGYLHILSRTDDIINVAGHRLSTGAMEEVLASHDAVAECAVIGVEDSIKGEVPLGMAVLKADVKRDPDEVATELVEAVRNTIGPVAAFKQAVVVTRLPKTRSGKILRATMRKIANGQPFKMPATIDDPAILDEIRAALKTLGYPKTD